MSCRGLFVGLTNIDYVYYLEEFPEENGKCKTTDYARYIGGPAANAAITYASLGGDATLVTALGRSMEAQNITDELSSYGVKVLNLAKDDATPSTSSIMISKDGERTIISGQRDFVEIMRDDINLDGYGFALFDCNQQNIAIPVLEKIRCDVVLDAGSFKGDTSKLLNRANIVISSENFRDPEGRDIFGMPYDNIQYKAMTRGEKSILTENGEIEVPKVNCIDSLAAGDIFHGAFCYAFYENKMNFDKALEFASNLASESVTHKGPRG